MNMKSFLPFHELNDREAIVVDGAHASGLVLSHWKGQNTQQGIADDTSGAVVRIARAGRLESS